METKPFSISKKDVLVSVAVVIFILLFVKVMQKPAHEEHKRQDYVAGSTSSSASSYTPSLNKEQMDAFTTLQSDGQIYIRDGYKVYVRPVLWTLMNAQEKEAFSYQCSRYCATMRGDQNYFAHIYDSQSGKKLAEYGAWGFKVL